MRKLSRPWWLVLSVAACGGDGDEPRLEPPTCEADGILRYVHDLDGEEVQGELPMNNYVFANKLSEDEPGYLEVGDPAGDHVRVEFAALLPKGDTVPASGSFTIGGREAGNCETTLVSRIHALPDEGWEVTLVALHAAPFCDGAALEGSFAACLIPAPF